VKQFAEPPKKLTVRKIPFRVFCSSCSIPFGDHVSHTKLAIAETAFTLLGLTSRNGNLRTIAAVHNALNQALASPGALHIESTTGDTSDRCEINRLSRLGVRDDPNLEVTERLVKEWNGLEAQRKELKGWEHEVARETVKGQMRELALEFKQEPQLELAVKRRAQELGIERGSRLARVLQEKNLERALSIAERDLGRGFGLSL
jgi:hypothetical protein